MGSAGTVHSLGPTTFRFSEMFPTWHHLSSVVISCPLGRQWHELWLFHVWLMPVIQFIQDRKCKEILTCQVEAPFRQARCFSCLAKNMPHTLNREPEVWMMMTTTIFPRSHTWLKRTVKSPMAQPAAQIRCRSELGTWRTRIWIFLRLCCVKRCKRQARVARCELNHKQPTVRDIDREKFRVRHVFWHSRFLGRSDLETNDTLSPVVPRSSHWRSSVPLGKGTTGMSHELPNCFDMKPEKKICGG